jgi:hypothetical protein
MKYDYNISDVRQTFFSEKMLFVIYLLFIKITKKVIVLIQYKKSYCYQ